jgi:hypothetical protein
MIKRLLLHVTRVIPAGWCAEWLLGGAYLDDRSVFSAEDPQILGAALQNLVA